MAVLKYKKGTEWVNLSFVEVDTTEEINDLDTRVQVFENALEVSDDSINLNGKYIDNALFR